MSAYIVSMHTLAFLSEYAESKRIYSVRDLFVEVIAQKLLDENWRSIESRYPKNHQSMGFRKYTAPKPTCHSIMDMGGPGLAFSSHAPLAVLSACSEYDYQACENADYADSWAGNLIQSLRLAAIAQLPGYREARGSWEPKLPGSTHAGSTT